MKHFIVPVLLASSLSVALAKLPPLDDAAKGKAAESAARAGWQGKVDVWQLCKAQDRVAAHYRKSGGKQVAVASGDTKPVAFSAPPPPAAAPPAKPESAGPGAAAAPAQPAPPGAAAPAGANVAAAQTGCADPGPFAYNPPVQKPLEASGAHSPAGTAAGPPSAVTPSAAMAPAKK